MSPYDETFGSFNPIKKKGRGDSVIKLPKGVTAAIVTMTHKGQANFAAMVLDSNNQPTGDLLANAIGNYSGTTIYGLSDMGGDAAKLKLSADGSWTVKIAPVSSAPRLGAKSSARGDAVFTYDGPAADWAITHRGSSNFAIFASDGQFPDLLVNEIGNYSGTVPMSAGPLVVSIQADGRWTMHRQ